MQQLSLAPKAENTPGRLTKPGDIMPAETVMRSIHHKQERRKENQQRDLLNRFV